MCNIIINGGKPLSGSVSVQGAKNSVLPILAATILCEGESVIEGCPALRDVDSAIEILKCLGCRVKVEKDAVIVDSKNVRCTDIPDELMLQMRSSITFLGAITARCRKARMSSPGGCELGPRPIDLHIKALRELGVRVEEKRGYTLTSVEEIKGADIHLDFPSVGATENAMIAATLGKGVTTITNAAKEPEIWDLQCFLRKMGAKVSGAGSDVITIEGVKKLRGAQHRVIPDRIVAATYLCGAAMTGGTIELLDAEPLHLNAVMSVLKDAGASVYAKKNSIMLMAPKRVAPVDILRTMPYPGFPTDAQAPITALLTVASGTSVVVENIFENRYKHCGELCKMGADIKTNGRVAVIRGVKRLTGSLVSAMELRGGAALTIAGAAAYGTTEISGIEYIERGYQNIVADLSALGVDIRKR